MKASPPSDRTAVPVALHTTSWGARKSERRAVLLHGLGSVGGTWWQIGEALARTGYFVVAPDLRGHGHSPSTSTYRVDDHIADLLELDSGWDLLVGHSFGGLLAAGLAGCDGYAGRALLIDPVLDIPDAYVELVLAEQLAEVAEAADVEAILAAHPRWHPRDGASKAQALASVRPPVIERTVRDNVPFHFSGYAEALRIPTVILGADPVAGGWFTAESGRRLTAANDNITVRIVPGAGHHIHRDDPAAVLAAAQSAPD
jgi:pimeloyl-ACP methyl ester carboxylesterase